ncbi:MAG TPA: magnesium/cobalt transporter CorA [Acidimicrobiales bacterium]|nr:magnesium/cobalt transporter CorA [Acidimicrobiales bacterium]
MDRLFHAAADGSRKIDVDPSEMSERRGDGWVWLDVLDPTDDDIDRLCREFDLDRLTRADLGDEAQFPKVDDLDSHIVVVTHGLANDDTQVRTVEIDLVLGPNWLLTVHDEPLLAVDHVFERSCHRRFELEGPDHLMARIIEFSGERFLPLLDGLDQRILDLEDQAIEGDPTILADVQVLRREVSTLRRVLGPQRSALLMAARLDELGPRAQRELSDALDHHTRLIESLDAAHGLLATVLDTYRAAAAEQMNEVMKVLTVFSAIVLPLSLIAGIYGMNFANMPELENPAAYFIVLAAMAVVALGLYLYFVRRGFIGGPKLSTLTRGTSRVGRGMASMAVLPVRAVGTVVRSPSGSNGDDEE